MKSLFLSQLKKRGLAILIAIFIFYILFISYSEAYSLIGYLSNVKNDLLIPVLLSVSLSLLIRSVRQLYLLKIINIRLHFKENALLYLAGLSMTVTPASLGQAIKSYFLYRNYGEPVSKTFPLVLVERYLDILAIFTFMAIFVLLMNIQVLLFPALIISLLLIVLPLLIRFHGLISHVVKRLFPYERVLPRFNKIQNNLLEFDESISSFFCVQSLIYGWPLSIAAWFFEALGIFFSFEALNIHIDFGLTTALGFSSLIFGAISLIPGGAGVTELIFLQLLSSYGLPIAEAAAAVLLVRLSSLWYSTLIGIVATKIILSQKKWTPTSA